MDKPRTLCRRRRMKPLKRAPAVEKEPLLSSSDDELLLELESAVEDISVYSKTLDTISGPTLKPGACHGLSALDNPQSLEESLSLLVQLEHDEHMAQLMQNEEEAAIVRQQKRLSIKSHFVKRKYMSPGKAETLEVLSDELCAYLFSFVGHLKPGPQMVNKRIRKCKLIADRDYFIHCLVSRTRLLDVHARRIEKEVYSLYNGVGKLYWARSRTLLFNLRDHIKSIKSPSSSASLSMRWTCWRCTLENSDHLKVCDVCQTKRVDPVQFQFQSNITSATLSSSSSSSSSSLSVSSTSSAVEIEGVSITESTLCNRVLSGELPAEVVASMSSDDMATPLVAAQRHEWARIGTELRAKKEPRPCTLYRCERCDGNRTRVWRVNRKLDVDRFTTLAECLNCHLRWEV